MAGITQYSAPNVVGARKLKALIFDTINQLLYEKRPLCVFEPLFEGLGAVYALHLRLIGKLVVDFLLVIIELLSVGFMADELRAYIDGKSPFLKGWVTLAQIFGCKGTSSTNHLCTFR